MIHRTDKLSVRWVPIDRISFPAQRCSPEQVAFYLSQFTEPDDQEQHLAPPVVSPLRNGTYRIRDGRHRILAHMMAGRHRVRCVVVLPP